MNSTHELGQHVATWNGSQLIISGTSGAVVLSVREAYELLETLYSFHNELFRKVNDLPEPEEPALPDWVVGEEAQ